MQRITDESCQISPTLALLLTHDLLLAKKGLALPQKHGLSTAISRHKARLAAELTKSRLRRGCASIDELRSHVNEQSKTGSTNGSTADTESTHPRWVRVNTLRTTLDEQLQTTFADYSRTAHLRDVTARGVNAKLLYIDDNVPNLVAIPQSLNITTESAYKDGKLILQDKASCFPALLLDPASATGDIIDACAAPGNKTTHLAALLASSELDTSDGRQDRKIIACERDATRSQTLARMVKVAGAEDMVHVKAKQDFMKLNPHSKEFANVTALLLDPSCSGSGIVGRDEVKLDIHLPDACKAQTPLTKGKKRKRNDANDHAKSTLEPAIEAQHEEVPTQLDDNDLKLQARLSALSDFQLRLLRHAMAFPAATRITYSTCSVYAEENEHVVSKALLSDIALERGWRILIRQDQIEGLRKWKKRGSVDALVETGIDADSKSAVLDVNAISDACIRFEKHSNDGTMGFFVAGFVRDVEASHNDVQFPEQGSEIARTNETGEEEPHGTSDDTEDEWDGFSDEES